MQELQQRQKASGATFIEGIPTSFGNDSAALQSASTGVALCDRSHWGLLKLTDADRLQFLHNQTTNEIKSLQPGQGCETVFVNSTGRTLDLATVYVTDDAAWVLVSPARREFLLDWLDRYIFPMDRLKLEDCSAAYAIFSLVGTASHALLQELGWDRIVSQPLAAHRLLLDSETRIAVGSGLGLPGYTLLVPQAEAVQVWSTLAAGAVPMGDRVWEQLRITQGRPRAEYELTEDYNPLEAGLWRAISFDKGCYIGQETIARLNTYKGVKQRLWGIQLLRPVPVNTPVEYAGKKVGVLTSCIETEQGAVGLAYIRTKAGGEGLEVTVDGVSGQAIAVPYLSHAYHSNE